MVKNKQKLIEFNQKLIEKENISHKQALLIYEDLYNEAVHLGAINSENIMNGLEVDLKIARAINGLGR